MADPTFAIAVSGLTVAAASVAWNIYNSLVRDSANLKLLVRRGKIASEVRSGAVEVGVDGPLLLTRAINHGRRPITVLSGGLEFGSRSKKVLMTGNKRLPIRLGESEEVTLWMAMEDLLDIIAGPDGSLPTRFWFMDTENKYHRRRIPRSLVRGLRAAT